MSLAIFWTFFLVYKRRIHPLGLPVLAGGIFFFIYVIQPLYLIVTGDIYYFLNNWQIAKSIFVAFVMYLVFIRGWLSGVKKRVILSNRYLIKWNYNKVYIVGLFLSILGSSLFLIFIIQSGGIYQFYSMPHGAAGAWQEQTAYVYMGEYLIYPGIALLIFAIVNLKFSFGRIFPLFIFILVLLFNAILTGDRGNFFLLVSTTGIAYFFATGKKPKTRTIIIGGIITGIIILLLVGYRDYLHLGPKNAPPIGVKDALFSMLAITDSQIKRGVVGIEFIYHSGVIDAVDKLQRYHLGINWFYSITVHLIPRIIWKEKPYAWNTPGITTEDMSLQLGWTRTSGSAPAIVADFYRQFGWLSLIFFYFLGVISGYFLKKVQCEKEPESMIIYTLWFSWGYKLFAHGFGAMLVPYFYVLIPTIFLVRICKKNIR